MIDNVIMTPKIIHFIQKKSKNVFTIFGFVGISSKML